ncbi:FAD synthase [Candidatus Micrarchaeota archaeon]|nr:FAD synthase [Candidatus Micrarchaeota archaeon]
MKTSISVHNATFRVLDMLVMVFGTFDFLHLGHLDFFKQAKALGNKLLVVVARDSNVKRIKGELPFFSECERLEMVQNLKIVDEAVLGDEKNFFSAVAAYKPGVIALGYDQRSLFEGYISEKLNELGLKTKIVRLKPFQGNRFKSSVLRKIYGVG